MKRTLNIILIGVAVALLFRHFCFEVIYVASPSMEPTYNTGEQIIINKLAYLFKKPKRGDIVMLQSPVSDKGLIKRIVGLPGERIEIRDKEVYIDGEKIDENYTQFLRPNTLLVGDNIEPFTIPREHYFVMGDNRDVSRDSRDWSEDKGMQTEVINIEQIEGKRFKLY